jgi:hypothetical protein
VQSWLCSVFTSAVLGELESSPPVNFSVSPFFATYLDLIFIFLIISCVRTTKLSVTIDHGFTGLYDIEPVKPYLAGNGLWFLDSGRYQFLALLSTQVADNVWR